jgi:hypothetical protein
LDAHGANALNDHVQCLQQELDAWLVEVIGKDFLRGLGAGEHQ